MKSDLFEKSSGIGKLRNWKSCDYLSKSLLSEFFSFSRDPSEMRYFGFFITFCFSIGCNNYLKSDLLENSAGIEKLR